MMARLQIWVALLLAHSLMLTGCSTTSRQVAGPSGSGKTRLSKKNSPDPEQRIRAHAHFAAGLAYDLNDKPDLALQEYYQAALNDPAYEPVVLESSRRFLRSRQTDKAIEVLSKAASLPDAPGTIHAWLGLAYAQAGKNDAAIAANKKAIKKMPQAIVAYQNLAQIYLQTGKTNEALRVLDDAAKQPITEPAFFVDLAEFYLRFARANPDRAELARERAKAALDRAGSLNPSNLFLLQKLAEGYVALGDLPKAEEFYAELIKANPEIVALRAKLAEIYVRNGQADKATEQLEALAREDPTNPQTHFYIGALALEQRQPEKAAESFERAILLNPDLEPAYYELTAAKLNLQKPREAWEALEKARARFKLNFTLEFYSGIVQSILKDYAEAIKHLVSAELLARTSAPSRLDHRFYFQFGAAYERYGDYAQAETYFRKCLELKPDFAEALNYLGYMWVEQDKNLEEAKELITKAVELEQDNAAFLDSMGWALFKLKQPREALTWLLKAIEHSEEPDATLFDHLGDIYAALNQTEEARDAWRKSLEVEPNDKIKQKLEAASPSNEAAR